MSTCRLKGKIRGGFGGVVADVVLGLQDVHMCIETGSVNWGICSSKGKAIELRKGGILGKLLSNAHDDLIKSGADLGKEGGACYQEITTVGCSFVGLC